MNWLAVLGFAASLIAGLGLYGTSPHAVVPKIAGRRKLWLGLSGMVLLASCFAWTAALGWGAGLCAAFASSMLVFAGWPFLAISFRPRPDASSREAR